MSEKNPKAATGGEVYVPLSARDGEESIVWFTRDLSAAGLAKAYDKVKKPISGHIAVKLHTGEPHGPNIIPREWVKALMLSELAGAIIVETNTYYEGDRDTTEKHRETIKTNGWTFAPVDIMDDKGTALLPVAGGKWCDEMSVGKGLLDYDSLVTLTHFKGHAMGGFGGSNKNLGIGCADAHIGKKWIHAGDNEGQWSIDQEELMERMTESTKATIDHFGEKIVYVNVMRNMSVSCDCEGVNAAPVVTPNVGILASTDICAIDAACVDLVMAMKPEDNHDLVERMTTRHSFRQHSYMHELGMGNWRYRLLDLDNGEAEITPAEGVAHVVPFEG